MSGIIPEPRPDVPATMGEDGKKHIDFFVATRERGLLNSMLETTAKKFEETHQGRKTRWEYAPPGDNSLVVAREALGFRVVDASEVGNLTANQQKEGIVRHGDLILMEGPAELVEEMLKFDGRAADSEAQLSDQSYRDNIKSISVTDKSGVEHEGNAVGSMRKTTEVIGAPEQQ
jgi:hypothetical protein